MILFPLYLVAPADQVEEKLPGLFDFKGERCLLSRECNGRECVCVFTSERRCWDAVQLAGLPSPMRILKLHRSDMVRLLQTERRPIAVDPGPGGLMYEPEELLAEIETGDDPLPNASVN